MSAAIAGEGGQSPFDEPIETDRHDFTQSARTVGVGVVQIEAGYTYFYKDQDEEIEQSHTAPELLLRLGLCEDVEFRLRWNYAWIFADAAEEVEDLDGAQDLVWGFKFQLSEQDPCHCWRSETALRLVSTIPSGGSDFTTNRVEIGVDGVYSWELPNEWPLAGSTGVYKNGAGEFSLVALGAPEESEEIDQFVAWAQSVALEIPLTERSELYLEWYGIFSDGLADEFNVQFVNAGLDYLLTDDFVVDFRAGRGLTDDADDFFAGVGGGIRF